MDITMEQYLASAVRYIQDRTWESAAMYFDELPESFYVPSVYFPVPRSESRKVTLETYLTTIRMEAWFCAGTDWQAYAGAAYVRDCILLDDCRIPVVAEDGTSGRAMGVTEPELSRVDERITKLAFGIRHYFSSQKSENRTEKICLSISAKPDSLYEAWTVATEGQRKEEEVQKQWLKKAAESLQR